MILARQIIRTNPPKYTLNGDLVREFLIFFSRCSLFNLLRILMLVLGKISVVGGWYLVKSNI